MKTKNIILALLILCGILVTLIVRADNSTSVDALKNVQEGDIIFQTSQSSQSKYIQKATDSPLTHCGILIKVGNEYKVLETLRTIQLTPLKKFIARGKNQKFWVRRSHQKNIKINYKKYIGRPYDLSFKMDNNRYYCSELVYDIYKQQLGIQLCTPRPIKTYNIKGMEKILTQRGMNPKQLVIAPSDLYDSPHLQEID